MTSSSGSPIPTLGFLPNPSLFGDYAGLQVVRGSGLAGGKISGAIDAYLDELQHELGALAEAYVAFANNGTPLGAIFPGSLLVSEFDELRDKPLADALELVADKLCSGADISSVILGDTSRSEPVPSSPSELLRHVATRLRGGAVVSLKNPGAEFFAEAASELDELRQEFLELFDEDVISTPSQSAVVNIEPTPGFFGDGLLGQLLGDIQALEDRLEALGLICFDAASERWHVLTPED